MLGIHLFELIRDDQSLSVSFIIAIATATLAKGNAITRMLHENRRLANCTSTV